MRPIAQLLSAAVLTASIALPALAADPAPAPVPVPGGQGTDLPVTKAVLYSSGVGYFEHDGNVKGDADVKLPFTLDQINDVLKSLVVLDAKGGTGASVTYASNDPLVRALRSFGIDLSDNPTLSQILGKLRGAKVVVKAPDPMEGVILNVESRTKVVGQPAATITEYVLTIVSGGVIRSISLANIDSIQLADPKLQDELNKALSLLASSRDVDRKTVTVHLFGKGDRAVSVAYIVQTPVWKTSYRLDLTDPEKPLIQGWAIVENTSDTDWKNVKLSLVAGRPISFVQDLYTPLYLDRPVVQPELYASLRPRVYEEGMDMDQNGKADAFFKSAARRGQGQQNQAWGQDKLAQKFDMGAAPEGQVGSGRAGEEIARAVMGSVPAAARGGGIGELFEFDLNQPVDLARRQSAMLPIVNDKIAAQKVSIYNQAVDATNPLNGVWLTNNTGNKLPAGPVTVFDGAYAGDAQIGHLSIDDKRLISYAVDLAVAVDPSVKSESHIVSAKIVQGVLQVNNKETYSQTYAIKNKAKVTRKIIVEHPFVNGRKLISPEKAEEKTPAYYRFAVSVEAGKEVKFEVKEELPVPQTIAILPQSTDTLVWYSSNGAISKPVRDALAKAVTLKNDLAQIESDLAENNRQLEQTKSDEDRLRKNFGTFGADSQIGKRTAEEFSAAEDGIKKLGGMIAELKKSADAKRTELANYLNGLNIAE